MSSSLIGTEAWRKVLLAETKGILSKKFWTRPKKGTQIHLVKGSDGKYHNVYVEP